MTETNGMKKANRNFTYVKDKKEAFIALFPDFKEFSTRKLETLSYYSQQTYLNAISRFYDITKKVDAKKITKEDILTFLDSEDFKNLSNKSKNHYILLIKKYLEFYKRTQLIRYFPTKKYKQKKKELNKVDLITREELSFLLKNMNTQKKAMTMVLYEGALRRRELVSIVFKNVKFSEEDNRMVDIFVSESKTILRNLSLFESVPYLREYFTQNEFQPNDRIFPFSESWITSFYSKLERKLKQKYPEQWTKHLHPHLFRHSRLTEMAASDWNQAMVGKYAGWVAGSNMAGVYFHIDNTDIKKKQREQYGIEEYEKPEIKTFKPIVCENCKAENGLQNVFCGKCGHILDESRVIQARVQEQVDIETLKEKNKELKQDIVSMKQLYKDEIKDLRTELKEMFDDLYYRKEVEEEVKKGEITSDEARIGMTKEEVKAEYPSAFSKPKPKKSK